MADSRLDAPLSTAEAAVRANPPDEIVAVRTMYKRVGIDPTKRRPSSEALLRRVRKGEGLPRINSMVDVCNWCSLEFQLPYGLYDASHIDGDASSCAWGFPANRIQAFARTTCTSEDASRWRTIAVRLATRRPIQRAPW